MDVAAQGRVIATSTREIWLGEDGIVRSIYLPGTTENLADAKAAIVAFGEVCGGIPRPVLVIAGNVSSVTRDARHYYATEQASRLILASAVVVGNVPARVIANFIIKVNAPPYLARTFVDREKALTWLRQFLDNARSDR